MVYALQLFAYCTYFGKKIKNIIVNWYSASTVHAVYKLPCKVSHALLVYAA